LDEGAAKIVRKAIRALGAALAVLALSVSAAAATVTIPEGGLDNRFCIDDPNEGRCITGTLVVEEGSSGTVTLYLYGKIEGQRTLLDQQDITVVEGDTEYEYTFCGVATHDANDVAYQSYIVTTDAENPESGESIDVEQECDDGIIPEVPAAILLVVTGGLAATWFVVRRVNLVQRRAALT
jgi:hypothetical protein